ncbi:MAG TPA: transketolase [Clostridiales bacterium UBA8153]|nr:transketolase [Clostridiales bacterium UBA8153]
MADIATRAAYGDALLALGHADHRVVVLDADLSSSTTTAKFAREFPERFFNFGIAEANMMGAAAGLASCGKVPFASTFAIFAVGRAYEQIRQSIAYAGFGVKIAATHAGITVGADGATHQSIEDLALMRVIPGMTVICPCDAQETEQAVWAASRLDGPVYLRLGRHPVPVVTPTGYRFEPGRIHRLRAGRDVCLAGTGIMVRACLEAAELLEQEGVDAEVLNVHTIKPLDTGALQESAVRCGAVVTAEEHTVVGGLGSAVAEWLSQAYPVPVQRVGIWDRFGQSGSAGELLEHYGLTALRVAEAARQAMVVRDG